mmetsp:Transcript_103952/g.324046  ORF Transcript_103952/g.324046 Transcript_103952/m.324046 type:complete len:269 (-) Transcript_103952:252-1058(-)
MRPGQGWLRPGLPGQGRCQRQEVRAEDAVQGPHPIAGRRAPCDMGARDHVHDRQRLCHPVAQDVQGLAVRLLPFGVRVGRQPRGRAAEPLRGLHRGRTSREVARLLRRVPHGCLGAPPRAAHRAPGPEAGERAAGRGRLREALRHGLCALRADQDQHSDGHARVHGAGADRLSSHTLPHGRLVGAGRVVLRGAGRADALPGRLRHRPCRPAPRDPPKPGDWDPELPLPLPLHGQGLRLEALAEEPERAARLFGGQGDQGAAVLQVRAL